MSYVQPATRDEIRTITLLATGFEQASAFVKVDVEHSIGNYQRFMDTGMGGMLALKDDDGTIRGGLGYVIATDLHSPRLMAIETFWFVDPEHRGAGIKLLTEFERLAAERKCDGIAMIHMTDSYPAALEKLYLRRGYKLIEQHYLKEIRP